MTGFPQVFTASQPLVSLAFLELEASRFPVLFSDPNYPPLLREILTILLLFPYPQFSVVSNMSYILILSEKTAFHYNLTILQYYETDSVQYPVITAYMIRVPTWFLWSLLVFLLLKHVEKLYLKTTHFAWSRSLLVLLEGFFYKVLLIAVNTNKDLTDPVLEWIAFNGISSLTCSVSEIHSSKCHLITHYAVTMTDKWLVYCMVYYHTVGKLQFLLRF